VESDNVTERHGPLNRRQETAIDVVEGTVEIKIIEDFDVILQQRASTI